MRGFPPERRITHSCRMASLLVPTLKLTSRKYMGRSFVEPSFDCSGVITSIGTGACCEKRRFLAASRPASESCGREGSREAVRRSIGREQTRGERPGATCGAHAPPARQTQTPCGNRRQPSRHRQPPWPQSIRRQQCWPGRRRSRGRSPAEHHAPPHTINRRRPAPRTGRGATRRSGRHPFRRRCEQGTRGTQRDRLSATSPGRYGAVPCKRAASGGFQAHSCTLASPMLRSPLLAPWHASYQSIRELPRTHCPAGVQS